MAIKVGDVVVYWTPHETQAEGVVADRAISPLTGNPRVRVVDFASEMSDPDAGKWLDVFSDIVTVR